MNHNVFTDSTSCFGLCYQTFYSSTIAMSTVPSFYPRNNCRIYKCFQNFCWGPTASSTHMTQSISIKPSKWHGQSADIIMSSYHHHIMISKIQCHILLFITYYLPFIIYYYYLLLIFIYYIIYNIIYYYTYIISSFTHDNELMTYILYYYHLLNIIQYDYLHTIYYYGHLLLFVMYYLL